MGGFVDWGRELRPDEIGWRRSTKLHARDSEPPEGRGPANEARGIWDEAREVLLSTCEWRSDVKGEERSDLKEEG